MFLSSPQAKRWRRIGIVLAAVSIASYLAYSSTTRPHGGSAMGLTYGVIALALVVLLALFGRRKRAYRSKVGTLEGWLQAHIALGLLVLLIVLFHTGFRFNDAVAVSAFVVLVLVVASGIVGAVLYSTVPRLLTDVGGDLEAEELATQLNGLATGIERLASNRSEAFRAVAQELVSEAAPQRLAGWRLLAKGRPGSRDRIDSPDWKRSIARVPGDEQEPLGRMMVLARQRRELELRLLYRQRYKNLLDVWLWLHLPLTFVLIILIAAHVVAALYFG